MLLPQSCPQSRLDHLQCFVVSADQMGAIESRLFAAGMPVAALMEKVAGLLARRIQTLYPQPQTQRVGVLVGPGHNGGDALVVARELHFKGYEVRVYCPFERQKDLTAHHANYGKSVGIPVVTTVDQLASCDLLIDGLFGFGLTRPITGDLGDDVEQLNHWHLPVCSIDLPSGIHTDRGDVLGTAVRASHTFCLGLWKLAFMQDEALDYMGQAELVDFDLPLADIRAVLGETPNRQRITQARAIAPLPIPRPAATHKYRQGHLLLVGGSRQYMGAVILAGLGARASGVGMLSIAVPASLKPSVIAQLPEALVLDCPETQTGAIAHLPDSIDLSAYSAIACGPGLTQAIAQTREAQTSKALVLQVLQADCPVLLDADGLNCLAALGATAALAQRPSPTVLTPHPGEFRRLFPDLVGQPGDRVEQVLAAAQRSGAVVLLKGARTAIATPAGTVYFNPDSTPALARGGSGDVLTGLLGGLLAQAEAQAIPVAEMVQSAAWWHAQAGMLAAQQRTQLGVDAYTLTQFLLPALQMALTAKTSANIPLTRP